jgi:hypothetical protein
MDHDRAFLCASASLRESSLVAADGRAGNVPEKTADGTRPSALIEAHARVTPHGEGNNAVIPSGR